LPSGNLDVASPGLAARLIDQNAAASCGSVLAPSADPTSGFFMAKLLDGVACGVRMPIGAPALTQTELDCVGEWLTSIAAAP
jgi:hypothetical protein